LVTHLDAGRGHAWRRRGADGGDRGGCAGGLKITRISTAVQATPFSRIASNGNGGSLKPVIPVATIFETQLFRRQAVEQYNGPDVTRNSGDTENPLEDLVSHEEDCTGSIACFRACACGYVCADRSSHCARRRLSSVVHHRRTGALCGLTDTIAGTRAYVWVPGRWDRPPHPGAHWVAHRWVRVHDHWEMREGTGASHLRWGGRRLRASCAEGERACASLSLRVRSNRPSLSR